jgi:hypothetical protein
LTRRKVVDGVHCTEVAGSEAQMLGTIRPCPCPDKAQKGLHTYVSAVRFGVLGAVVQSVGLAMIGAAGTGPEDATDFVSLVVKCPDGRLLTLNAPGLIVSSLEQGS